MQHPARHYKAEAPRSPRAPHRPLIHRHLLFALVVCLSAVFYMNPTVARTLLSSVRTTLPKRFLTSSTPAFFQRQQQEQPVITLQNQQQTAKMSSNSLIKLIKERRTHYALGKDLPVGKDKIQEIVNEAVQHVPSSFNSQSNRVVVLFGDEHDKFWNLVAETLKAIVPAEGWAETEARNNGFKAAAGTILFFEDQTVVEKMQAQFATYADKFPLWATQSDAMLQYALWVALDQENVGASLQHYNPLVDEKVATTWNIPKEWKLNAQLVFGNKLGSAGDKEFAPLETKVKVFGA
ncbi:nitroreductase [Pyricularia oryzae 70-15]|uniref:Nitroreductase n=1 Tax=Pyricularia oryzae (strain 70-15 / ATCC MYA-4617 / FGSC 8958) TaxID=242507 RepID=G4MPS3_PYRO7|nr:nitroreductase [Pyricularia oryzae 70-15]EHA57220.1 nitroreductase [Pyricularia oryzae 70-15]KAI7922202.1 nitroreductase [Pyricularia oryzae]KAI7926061.1 nitroreductase [Pyricularia oryzae]